MDVYVLGSALAPACTRAAGERLEEMVFTTARAALDDAAVERDAIGQVTLASSDELDGRSIAGMLLAAPAGAYLKDEMRCTDAGLIGLCLAATRLAAGPCGLGLVVSWNKSSVAPFEDVMRMRAEPFHTRPIGLNAAIADGLFAGAVAETHGITEQEATQETLDGFARAARNPRAVKRALPDAASVAGSPYVAMPLRAGHRAPLTDGAVAMVLATGEWLTRHPGARPQARLAGLGWAVDAYALGRERLSGFGSLRAAVGRAFGAAGIAPVQLDVFEPDGQTGWHLAAYRRAFPEVDPDAVAPGGGAFAQNPYFCTGLVNAAEAVLQLAGRAGPMQRPRPRWAAAHGTHGFALQGNAVAVFEGV